MEKKENGESRKERKVRALALEIALRGREEAKESATPNEIKEADEYLARLASFDGRVELGARLLVLQDTIERARQEGAYKIVLDGTARYAELAKLADFSSTFVSEREAHEEREAEALAYLESTGVIKQGLSLSEAARLVAQYVIDEILTRKIKEERKESQQWERS